MRLPTISMLALAAGLLFGTAALHADDPAPAPAKDVGTITGKVVDKDGNAVKDATVNVVTPPAPGAAAPARGQRTPPVATGKSGDDGTFKIENVPVGKYNVTAMVRGTGMGRTKDAVTVEKDKSADAGTITLQARQGGRGGNGGNAAGGN